MTTAHRLADERFDMLVRAVLPPLTSADVATLTDPLSSVEIDRLVDTIDIRRILYDAEMGVSPTIFNAVIGSLRVLGYSYRWLADVMGLDMGDIMPRSEPVSRDLMGLALTVAARIGDRPATPESTGMSQAEINDMRLLARRQHYGPPAAYDEVYTLVEGSARAAKTANAGRSASRREADKIAALAYFVRHGGSGRQIGRLYGFAAETFRGWVSVLGLRVVNHGDVRAAPGQERLLAAILAAAAAVEADGDSITAWNNLREEAAQIRADRDRGEDEAAA